MYSGIVTPMITPFNRKGEIDYNATEVLIEDLKKYGVSGLFPMGSTGLFSFFKMEERKEFLKYVNDHSMKMVTFAGIGSSSTQEAIELSKYSSDLGIKVRVLMPTYYIKPDDEWMIKHFSDVISSSDSDIFIYNIPQLSGSNISADIVSKLKDEFSQVKGIKDSSGDMRSFSKMFKFHSSDFSIFQGQDDLLLVSLALGADGGVCGTSNFSPSIVQLYNAYKDGNISRARDTQIDVVNELMYPVNAPNFPAGYYYAFYKKHNMDGGYRSPMLKPDDQKAKLIDKALSSNSRQI